jgi:N6-L-threonylcarbamoyladenine synthase
MLSNKKNLKILAIESSCDETAAAIVEYKNDEVKILSNTINSQIDIHKAFGGVFPEVASKAHAENIIPVIEESLDKSEIRMSKSEKMNYIDIIAVTAGPGLIGSLLVGVNAAKTLAFAHNKPIMPINHWLGHIYSCFPTLENSNDETRISNKLSNDLNINKLKFDSKLKIQNLPQFPLLALIVSGGHTGLVYMKSHTEYETIGQTLDDAAGEAFDKVAKLLELGYPGGPAIGKAAKKFRIQNSELKIDIKFPRPMLKSGDYNFSFSGLKTSVLNKVRELTQTYTLDEIKNQIAYEFQQAIIDTLITKTLAAAKEYNPKSICLCGGVSANKELREQLARAIENYNSNNPGPKPITLNLAPLALTGDNAAMIGIAAAYQLANGVEPTTFAHVNANSNLKL